jgi:hypothetical protein
MELVPGPGIGHPAGFGAYHNSGGNGCRRFSRSAEILSINLLAGRHGSCLERVFIYESVFLGGLCFFVPVTVVGFSNQNLMCRGRKIKVPEAANEVNSI